MNAFTLPAVSLDYRADLASAIMAMPASQLIGLRVLGFSEHGISLIELPIIPALTFDGRVVQGGIVGMLADYAGVSAAACKLEIGWMAATTGFEVHNLAPAKGKRLIAIGRAVQVGATHAVSSAEVWAEQLSESGAPQYRQVCIATTTCKPFSLR